MVGDIRWKQRFDSFQVALHQLTQGVELMNERALSDLERQGLILRFKFTHELAWNVLKDYLEMEGIQGLVGSRSTACNSPVSSHTCKFRKMQTQEGEQQTSWWLSCLAG